MDTDLSQETGKAGNSLAVCLLTSLVLCFSLESQLVIGRRDGKQVYMHMYVWSVWEPEVDLGDIYQWLSVLVFEAEPLTRLQLIK